MTATVPEEARAVRAARGIAAAGARAPQTSSRDPDDIAPFAVYLASDHAANVNGHVFRVYGGNVSLMSAPPGDQHHIQRRALVPGRPSRAGRDYLTKDISNPAPAITPQQ